MKVFSNFDLDVVSDYDDDDIKRLLNDSGIIRNRNKIKATIHNANEFKCITQKHGNFRNWLNSMDKSRNYGLAVKELQGIFKHVGPNTAHIFLFSIGEDIKYNETIH